MSALAVTPKPTGVDCDPLRDVRHKTARAARDQADWLAWLELGGAAPRTLSDYEWATARLLRALPHTGYDEFTAADIAHVLRSFPPRGRRTKKAAYDSWFAWGERTGRREKNPMRQLPTIAREKQRAIEVFTDAEIAQLTGLPENNGDLFLILLDAGLRRSEARCLQVRHLRFDTAELVVWGGKGAKDRVVPMTTRLVSRLAAWVELDALRATDHLWPTRPGGYYLQRRRPMGDTSFITWYRRCLDDAGVRYRNPHVTRHTFATRWLRRGGRLETLSRALGHSSIRTTADLYAHLDLTDVARDLALIEGR